MYFIGKKELRQMVQQAKDLNLTINVRHAKMLFCGASRSGKSSFTRLLRNKSHEELESTDAGHVEQVLVTGKVNVVENDWIDLDSKSETQALTERIIVKLRTVTELRNSEPEDQLKESMVNSSDTLLPVSTHEIESNDTNKSSTETKRVDSTDDDNSQLKSKQPVKTDEHIKKTYVEKSNPEVQSPVSIIENFRLDIENIMAAFNQRPISELENSIPDWDLFTLLDTGGQPEFINMLPAINTDTAITFVVLNMSKGIDCLATPVVAQYDREGYNYPKEQLEYTNMRLLECLLSTIRISALQKKSFIHYDVIKIVKDDKHPKPIVCVIGTHADKVIGMLVDVIDHIHNSINELEVFKEKYNKDFIIWGDAKNRKCVYAVDNTIPRDTKMLSEDPSIQSIQEITKENVKNIRDSSNDLLKNKAQYEIPISWYILELEIRTLCKKYEKVCISLDDVKEISDIIMPQDKKMKMTVIKEAMKFYHMLGTLLYFDEVDGMNQYVITDPQWLFTNLTKIVTCRFEKNISYNANHINKLKNEGICDVDLLKKLQLDQEVEMESFLALLVHLKVIAPTDDSKQEYFIPSVLPMRGYSKNIFKDEKQFGRAVIDPLLIEFTFGTIPRGLFSLLVVQLLQDNESYELYSENDPSNNMYYCCADFVTFHIDPGWYVTLMDKISYLELQVRVRKNKRFCHYQVQQTVTKALNTICDQFDWPFSNRRYGFLCKECSNVGHSHVSVLSAKEPIPSVIGDETTCTCNKRYMDLKEKQKIWFKVCNN